MFDVEPTVRHMLLCEGVQQDPNDPRKVSVLGFLSTLSPTADPPFPLPMPEFCVYLVLTGGRGSGDVEVAVVHADSDRLVFATHRHTLSFGPNPAATLGLVFRVRDGLLPEGGLYWVEFRYNDKQIARQPLLVR